MHQVYNEYFDSPNRYISHSALTQFLGEWENALSVLTVLENLPTQSSHDTRRIMNFLFQGTLKTLNGSDVEKSLNGFAKTWSKWVT